MGWGTIVDETRVSYSADLPEDLPEVHQSVLQAFCGNIPGLVVASACNGTHALGQADFVPWVESSGDISAVQAVRDSNMTLARLHATWRLLKMFFPGIRQPIAKALISYHPVRRGDCLE